MVVSFHQVTLAVFLEIFNNLMFVETPVIVTLIRARLCPNTFKVEAQHPRNHRAWRQRHYCHPSPLNATATRLAGLP